MMSNEVAPVVAILAMALAAAVTRVAGFWLMGHVQVTPRVRRMLETLPGAIVVATVAPLALKGGPAGLLGIGVAFAAMMLRRNEFLAVALGLTMIALARNFGF
jgi:branched chain amino acid efflux pump